MQANINEQYDRLQCSSKVAISAVAAGTSNGQLIEFLICTGIYYERHEWPRQGLGIAHRI